MIKAYQLNNSSRIAGAAIAAIAIAGCGGNAASPPGAVTVVAPSTATLQLAVGTATLFGTENGMNVLSTLRTPAGKSVLVTTPTLRGPFVLPATAGTANGTGSTITSGPSTAEIAAKGEIEGTPQVAPGTVVIPASTFGTSGGIFADGYQPSNADNQGTVASTPYVQPNYDACDQFGVNGDCGSTDTAQAVQPNAFNPIGGPPAYDPNGAGQGTRDGTFSSGILGVNEGINTFANTSARAGTYTQSVLIPSNGSVQTTLTKTFALANQIYLPVAAVPTYVPDGSGGGTFAVTLPAGVTDALLNVEDLGPDYAALVAGNVAAQPGSCYTNGSYPAYFTIHVTGSGTVTLPDTDGVGSPTTRNPTICTAAENTAANGGTATDADSYVVQLIGADYPLYAFNTLFTLSSPDPAILGASGSDDITVSPYAYSPDFAANAAGAGSKHRKVISAKFRAKALY